MAGLAKMHCIIVNKIWLGTIKNNSLSQSIQKQTQGKDLSFNKKNVNSVEKKNTCN